MREKLAGFYEAGIPPVSKRGKRWINPLLLAVTLFTTTLAGAILAGVNPIREPTLLYQGLPFSLSLMAILGTHELGHFLVARHRGVEVSWPYFIPAPPPPLTLWGTFGAFIKIKSALPDRRTLLDIGIAGPLAGLALTIPAIVIGLHLSEVREALPSSEIPSISLGTSLLFSLLTHWVLGISSDSHHIILHPIAFAGWTGMFVTAINLLPVGQLDGGHIVYALFKKRHFLITRATFVSFFPLGILWHGWFLWALLIFFFRLMHHPPPLDQFTPLDGRRKILGASGIVAFILCFTPIPLYIQG